MKELIVYPTFYDRFCILIVTQIGQLQKLKTPFVVVCIEVVADIPLKAKFHVSEVFITKKDKLVYLIWGRFFYHTYFTIIQQ